MVRAHDACEAVIDIVLCTQEAIGFRVDFRVMIHEPHDLEGRVLAGGETVSGAQIPGLLIHQFKKARRLDIRPGIGPNGALFHQETTILGNRHRAKAVAGTCDSQYVRRVDSRGGNQLADALRNAFPPIVGPLFMKFFLGIIGVDGVKLAGN